MQRLYENNDGLGASSMERFTQGTLALPLPSLPFRALFFHGAARGKSLEVSIRVRGASEDERSGESAASDTVISGIPVSWVGGWGGAESSLRTGKRRQEGQ